MHEQEFASTILRACVYFYYCCCHPLFVFLYLDYLKVAFLLSLGNWQDFKRNTAQYEGKT